MNTDYQKNKSQIAAQDIYIKLRKLIFDGQLKSGERITEDALSKRINASRTPIRQALAWADASGLVVIHPNRGATVRSYSFRDIIEVYDIWALLEGYAAYLATLKSDKNQLKFLKKETEAMGAVFKMTSANSKERAYHFLKHNKNFHNKILDMAGNRRLLEMAKKEDNTLLELRATQWFNQDDWRGAVFFHNKIINAITKHEPVRAQNLMREHIYTAKEACLSHVNEEDII